VEREERVVTQRQLRKPGGEKRSEQTDWGGAKKNVPMSEDHQRRRGGRPLQKRSFRKRKTQTTKVKKGHCVNGCNGRTMWG